MQPGSACVKRRAGACTRAAPLASVGPDTGGAGSSAPVEDGPARPRTIRPAPVSNVPRPVEDGQPGLSNMGSPGPARPRGWPSPPRQRQGWPVRPSYPPRGLGQCRAVSGPVASLEDGPGPGPVEHERHPDRASLERACGPGPAPRKRPARMAARTRTSADAARPSSASPRNRPILAGSAPAPALVSPPTPASPTSGRMDPPGPETARHWPSPPRWPPNLPARKDSLHGANSRCAPPPLKDGQDRPRPPAPPR